MKNANSQTHTDNATRKMEYFQRQRCCRRLSWRTCLRTTQRLPRDPATKSLSNERHMVNPRSRRVLSLGPRRHRKTAEKPFNDRLTAVLPTTKTFLFFCQRLKRKLGFSANDKYESLSLFFYQQQKTKTSFLSSFLRSLFWLLRLHLCELSRLKVTMRMMRSPLVLRDYTTLLSRGSAAAAAAAGESIKTHAHTHRDGAFLCRSSEGSFPEEAVHRARCKTNIGVLYTIRAGEICITG